MKRAPARVTDIYRAFSVSMFQALGPETGSDVLSVVEKALIGCLLVERAELRNVWPDLHIVESFEKLRLNFCPAGIEGYLDIGMAAAHMGGNGKYGGRILSLPQEKKAVHAEVLFNEPVDCLNRELFAYIILQERGMAADAGTLAVGNLNCQGHSVRYLLQNYVICPGNVLNHLT